MKLYEISKDYRQIQEMDFDPQVMSDTLESLQGDFEDKANKIARVNANMSAEIDAIKAEITRLTAMKKVRENKQNALKDYLRLNMESCAITKMTCPLFTITLRKPVKVVSIDDAESIPRDYYKVTESIDKSLIKQALKDGHAVKGASLKDGNPGLVIK